MLAVYVLICPGVLFEDERDVQDRRRFDQSQRLVHGVFGEEIAALLT